VRKVFSIVAPLFILAFSVCAWAQSDDAQANTAPEKKWEGKFTLGFNKANGNTNKTTFATAAEIKRLLKDKELSFGGESLYSSSDGKMDAQKWMLRARYAYDFGKSKRWFNSYQFSVEHDKFADINYRLLPQAGVGYWLSKTDDLKASLEGSLGYQITDYNLGEDREEAVAILRAFVDKRVFEKSRISEDFSLIPSLEGNGMRIKSITAFTNPISDDIDFVVKYIIDHNTEPPAATKKTDTLLIVGATYTF
jgi:putative salt-induced outer membrane protein